MDKRALKDRLYKQVARVGKAPASPKRLAVLAQGEKAVETVAEEHLLDLRLARGHRARKTFDGVSEWQAAGVPLQPA